MAPAGKAQGDVRVVDGYKMPPWLAQIRPGYGKTNLLKDSVDEILDGPATDGGPGTLRDQLARHAGPGDSVAQAGPEHPVCQAIRPRLGTWGPCSCPVVQRYRVGCRNEHVGEEWLCRCCASAPRTCGCTVTGPADVRKRICGEALTAVPLDGPGPSAADVPPSVQRMRGRAAGPGDDESWFRSAGE
jgi:hypothetical protein